MPWCGMGGQNKEQAGEKEMWAADGENSVNRMLRAWDT